MKSDSLALKAYTEIRKKILSAQISPKTRLKEDYWANKLKVSRMAIRETLTRLLGEQLVMLFLPHEVYFSLSQPSKFPHNAVIYPGPKGNWIFNAGTIWWAEGLANPPGHIPAGESGMEEFLRPGEYPAP
jgi:hypothetical protein